MDCNRDEATRAKAIAESKLEQKDYFGAKKFALKAQNLYPGLDGISQMLIVLEVYLRAENMISGEVDWYRVLDLHPLADDDTIKKQYKKLSLLLHPDKNRSIGAVGAFQLISDAHKLLKDKQLREAYNQRRTRCMGLQLKVPTHSGGPSVSCWPNRSVPPRPNEQKVPSAPTQRSRKTDPSAPLQQRQVKVPAHAPKSQNRRSKVPMASDPPTFWTMCSSCRIQFEYNKKFWRCNLRCQECNTAFPAIEIRKPKFSAGSGPVPWQRKRQTANSLNQNAAANYSMNTNSEQGPLPGSVDTVNREKTGNAVKRSSTEEAQGPGGWEGDPKKVKLAATKKL